jgi:hypothetical protein
MTKQRDNGEPVGNAAHQRGLRGELHTCEPGIYGLQTPADEEQHRQQRQQGKGDQSTAPEPPSLVSLVHCRRQFAIASASLCIRKSLMTGTMSGMRVARNR